MKKTLIIALALVLLCTLAIGGTLTYFTDKDFDKNTMTVGNVKIEQIEDLSEDLSLFPYVGDPTKTETKFDPSLNAVQKTVTVKNIGSEPAYVRTLFAFEAVKFKNAEAVDPIAAGIIHADYNTDAAVGTWELMGSVTVGNDLYYVYSFTYASALAKDATTPASLKAIALDSEQGNEFYDAVGSEYNVLVVSQAVQTAGFTGTTTAVADAFAAAFPFGEDGVGNQTVIPSDWFSAN